MVICTRGRTSVVMTAAAVRREMAKGAGSWYIKNPTCIQIRPIRVSGIRARKERMDRR
jgi:hypothetical protein